MKHILTIIFIFLFTNIYCQKTKFDKFQILGTWKLTGTVKSNKKSSGEIFTPCNVCPDIKLSSDRFAKVFFPDGEIQIFLFKIERNKLTLRTTIDNKNPFFDDTYLVKIKNNSDSLEMELKQKKLSYTYILRKKMPPTPVKRGSIQK